eukprot:3939304-Rhodomonas_salina.1
MAPTRERYTPLFEPLALGMRALVLTQHVAVAGVHDDLPGHRERVQLRVHDVVPDADGARAHRLLPRDQVGPAVVHEAHARGDPCGAAQLREGAAGDESAGRGVAAPVCGAFLAVRDPARGAREARGRGDLQDVQRLLPRAGQEVQRRPRARPRAARALEGPRQHHPQRTGRCAGEGVRHPGAAAGDPALHRALPRASAGRGGPPQPRREALHPAGAPEEHLAQGLRAHLGRALGDHHPVPRQ